MNLRERFARFMYGRYGNDDLNRVYSLIAIVFLFLGLGFRSNLLYFVGLLILTYSVYRSLSKNVQKMYAQNQKFLNWRYRMAAKWNQWKKRMAQRKDYRFYRCPACKQRVRVPRGRGRIEITCPKCGKGFIKKS